MVAIASPQVVEAQRLAAELQEALAARKDAALLIARVRERGGDDAAAVAALRAATECVQALLARLETLLPPVYGLN